MTAVTEHERELNRARVSRWRKRHPEKAPSREDRNARKRTWMAGLRGKVLMALNRTREKGKRNGHVGCTATADELIRAWTGGACFLCNAKCSTLCVDHDHKTGKFRGWLCMSCNVGIGHLRDDPNLLRRAIAYLEVV